jgi:hypothetical protein
MLKFLINSEVDEQHQNKDGTFFDPNCPSIVEYSKLKHEAISPIGFHARANCIALELTHRTCSNRRRMSDERCIVDWPGTLRERNHLEDLMVEGKRV